MIFKGKSETCVQNLGNDCKTNELDKLTDCCFLQDRSFTKTRSAASRSVQHAKQEKAVSFSSFKAYHFDL